MFHGPLFRHQEMEISNSGKPPLSTIHQLQTKGQEHEDVVPAGEMLWRLMAGDMYLSLSGNGL